MDKDYTHTQKDSETDKFIIGWINASWVFLQVSLMSAVIPFGCKTYLFPSCDFK